MLGGLHKLGELVLLQREVVTAQHGLLHHGVRALHAAPEAGARSGSGQLEAGGWRPGTWRRRRRRGCCRGRALRRTPRWRGSCSSSAWGRHAAARGRGRVAGRHTRLPFTHSIIREMTFQNINSSLKLEVLQYSSPLRCDYVYNTLYYIALREVRQKGLWYFGNMF